MMWVPWEEGWLGGRYSRPMASGTHQAGTQADQVSQGCWGTCHRGHQVAPTCCQARCFRELMLPTTKPPSQKQQSPECHLLPSTLTGVPGHCVMSLGSSWESTSQREPVETRTPSPQGRHISLSTLAQDHSDHPHCLLVSRCGYGWGCSAPNFKGKKRRGLASSPALAKRTLCTDGHAPYLDCPAQHPLPTSGHWSPEPWLVQPRSLLALHLNELNFK